LLSSLVLGLALGHGANSPADQVAWRAGAAWQRQLETPVGVSWAGVPLRQALRGLAQSQQVAIFLDRRVDPNQQIDFAAQDVPLRECLTQLAGQVGAGVGYVGPVVYLGPEATAGKLATVVALQNEALRRVPPERQRRMTRAQAWQWADLATPGELLEQLARDCGLRIAEPGSIPHDLWPAANLPPMTAVERLTLLLAGFDLSYQWSADGQAVKLIPIPDQLAVRRTYDVGPRGTQLLPRLSRELPGAHLTLEGPKLVVVGRVEQHQHVDRVLTGTPPPPARTIPGRTRYSLQVQNQPVGQLIKTLAEKLSLEPHWDQVPAAQMQTRVSLAVKEVTRDELLRAVLQPAGLTFRLSETQLHVRPAAP